MDLCILSNGETSVTYSCNYMQMGQDLRFGDVFIIPKCIPHSFGTSDLGDHVMTQAVILILPDVQSSCMQGTLRPMW